MQRRNPWSSISPRSPARCRRALRSPKPAPPSISSRSTPHGRSAFWPRARTIVAINPLGYVPALRLDDGTVLTENSAILQYIAEQYPDAQLAPPASDRVGRAKLRQWLSFISAELHKGLMTPLLGDKTPPEVKAWTVEQIRAAPRLSRRPFERPGIPARPLQRRGRLSDHGLELDARDASDRSLRLSQRESLSRAHASEAERRCTLWRPRFPCSTRKSRGARRREASKLV